MRYLPPIKSTQSLPKQNCPSSLEGVVMSDSWIDSLNDRWDRGRNERLEYGEEAPPSPRHPPWKILFQGQPLVAASSPSEQGRAWRCSLVGQALSEEEEDFGWKSFATWQGSKMVSPLCHDGLFCPGSRGGERNETLAAADTELTKVSLSLHHCEPTLGRDHPLGFKLH